MFLNKQTSRGAAVARYGAIDFASKHWPRQAEFMQMIDVDPKHFPNWMVENSKHPVEHIYVNKDMALPLLQALKSLVERNLAHLLVSYDGCFNIRMVRGSAGSPSCHSYGLAIDLNADTNQLGSSSGGFYDHMDLVKCFVEQGFAWGGRFHSRKDPMHFSYAWEG